MRNEESMINDGQWWLMLTVDDGEFRLPCVVLLMPYSSLSCKLGSVPKSNSKNMTLYQHNVVMTEVCHSDWDPVNHSCKLCSRAFESCTTNILAAVLKWCKWQSNPASENLWQYIIVSTHQSQPPLIIFVFVLSKWAHHATSSHGVPLNIDDQSFLIRTPNISWDVGEWWTDPFTDSFWCIPLLVSLIIDH